MTDDTPRLCFSYLRFSRAEQAKGSSTKRQTDLREAYCQRHNLVLDTSRMITDEGISAYNGHNSVEGNLAEFLDLVKGGSVPRGSVLLIESIDRLSRDQIIPARNLLESILLAGIDVHTLQPERIYTSKSLEDVQSLILMILEFSRAHDYSQQLGNRISAAWSSKREKAKTNQTPLSKCPPAWLRVVDGKYEVIPERGKVVELIYQLCADGMGVNLITKDLKNRAIYLSKTRLPTVTQDKIVSRPLPPPPTGTSQGPTRELSQGTGIFPLNRIFTGRTSVKRFLRKPKRDASRIRVTRPSPSLLARDLKSMSLRIRCDIKSCDGSA